MDHWIVVLAQTNPLDVTLVVILGAVFLSVAFAIAWSRWKAQSVRRRLRQLFGKRYRLLPVVSRPISILDIPNIRRALEAFAAGNNATFEVFTVGASVESVTNCAGWGLQSDKLVPVAPKLRQMDIGVDEREDCLTNALYLVQGRESRWAIFIMGVETHGASQPVMEVLSPSQEQSSKCLQELRRLMRIHSIYRGKVISIEKQGQGLDDYDRQAAGTHVQFHRLPSVSGNAIILPPDTMKRIQRNTIGFFRNVERLKQKGFSAKRGLL